MLTRIKENPLLVVLGMVLGIISSLVTIKPLLQPQYPTCDGEFYIPGAEERGVQCRALVAGTYTITYLEGAYFTEAKTFADPGEGIWRTAICVINGDRPQRDSESQLVCDQELFRPDIDKWDEVTQSQDAAANHILADGSLTTTINLNSNEVLTFVARDVEDTYRDNGEFVKLEIKPLSRANN